MSFFPDPIFAWISFLVLVGFAAVAAYVDLTKAIIPNKLNLTILATGVVMNLVRGGWLGATGRPVWWLCKDSPNLWFGLADGLLFSLAGFALAFAVLTALWMLTQTGAGDVKLFAALGAWMGVYGFVWVWMVSLPLLMVWMGVKLAFGAPVRRKQDKKNDSRLPKGWRTRTTYSLPIAVSVLLCGLWIYRVDLQLATLPAPPANVGNGSPDGTPPTNSK